ncbi:MAG TPA: amidohydrolase [Candidatus Alistipes pullicola]|nr:amidohydrolase [Candidatus Alistipes pullicola]
MKITLIQTDLLWNDPAGNRARFEQKIAEAGSADLIVLPEMFSTGFCTQPRLAAEPLGGETLPWMKRIAQKTDCALAGSVAVEENGNYFNRFYFVKPDGSVSQYDKRHLFTYGGEHKEFTAGDKRVIVEYKGWRILLQICYDLRFPVWSRNRNDYDLALYTANWPTPRVDAWSALLRARAIENLCYVAGINRTGTDPNCSYCGKSALLDFKGQTLADVEPGKEALLSAELDADALRDFRKNFPALQDADRFSLE